MIDPIEFYRYPEEWVKKRKEVEGKKEVCGKIGSGLYILTEDGWLRRGISTATTASAAICGLICGEKEVIVATPSGLKVMVEVRIQDSESRAIKFSGDHAFDVTDGIEIVARKADKGINFGRGIGMLRNRKAVSSSAIRQITDNFRRYAERNGYNAGVKVEVPEGEKIAMRTDNARIGIKGGISLLGTTGFVEPWCKKLIETKIEIAKRYDGVAITTGRKGWKWCMENQDYQPFVFGMHIEEALRALDCPIILAGLPSLLVKWAVPDLRGKLLSGMDLGKYRGKILEKARKINGNVEDVVLL